MNLFREFVNDRLTPFGIIDSEGSPCVPRGPLSWPLSAALDSPLVCVCLCVSVLCFLSGRRSQQIPPYMPHCLFYSLPLWLKGAWILKSNCYPLPLTSLLTTFSREVSSTVTQRVTVRYWKKKRKKRTEWVCNKIIRCNEPLHICWVIGWILQLTGIQKVNIMKITDAIA